MTELSSEDKQFIKELREQHEAGKINRRQALGMLGAAGVGAAGGFFGAGTASASDHDDSQGNIGTASDPVDGWFDTINPPGGPGSGNSTGIEWSSANQLQTAGDILVYGAGNALIERLNVSNTTTPVQDAIDSIGSANAGRIELPPTTFQDPGGWTDLGKKSLLGTWRATKVEITDETTPVIDVNTSGDLHVSFIDGIWFENVTTPRMAPAIDWDVNTRESHMGRVYFNNFSGDDLFSFTGGGPWSSQWEWVHGRNYNRFINWGSSGMPAFEIKNALLRSDDESTPEIERTDSSSTGQITIGSWNKGQVACPMFVGTGDTYLSAIDLGAGNYEPTTDNGGFDHIFDFGYALRVALKSFGTHGNFTVNDTRINISNNQGHKFIDSNIPIKIETDNKGPLLYTGNSGDVAKGSGTPTDLTQGVAALGDLTLVT